MHAELTAARADLASLAREAKDFLLGLEFDESCQRALGRARRIRQRGVREGDRPAVDDAFNRLGAAVKRRFGIGSEEWDRWLDLGERYEVLLLEDRAALVSELAGVVLLGISSGRELDREWRKRETAARRTYAGCRIEAEVLT